MEAKYRSLYVVVYNDGKICDQMVHVFLKTGQDSDLILENKLLMVENKWPVNGTLIRVDIKDGQVELLDTRKNYALEFSATVEGNRILTYSLRLRHSNASRRGRNIEVRAYTQAGSERDVFSSVEIYSGSKKASTELNGLCPKPRAPRDGKGDGKKKSEKRDAVTSSSKDVGIDTVEGKDPKSKEKKKKTAKPKKEINSAMAESKPEEESSKETREKWDENSNVGDLTESEDDKVIRLDVGVSKFMTKVSSLPQIKQLARDRKVIFLKSQKDYDDMLSKELLQRFVILNSRPIALQSGHYEGQKYMHDGKQELSKMIIDSFDSDDALFLAVLNGQ